MAAGIVSARRAVEAVWRLESARIVAGLAGLVRDVGLAEELAQDALVAALEQWPAEGIPANPGATANAKVTPCAVCGQPATDWAYDGLDPDERRDPHTGKAWSADITHYRPVCAAHGAFSVQAVPGDG